MASEARSDLVNCFVLDNFTYLPNIRSPGHPIRLKSVLWYFLRRRWNGQLLDLRCSWAAAGKNSFELTMYAVQYALWKSHVINETDLIFFVGYSRRRLPPTHCHLRVIPTYPFPSTRTSNFRSNTCCRCRDRALHHHPLYIILWEGWFNAWERGGRRRIKRTVLASSQRRAASLRSSERQAAIVQIC